jgi:hypothetical protein
MSSYEETVWLGATGTSAQLPRAGSKHHELKSIVRFFTAKYVILQ